MNTSNRTSPTTPRSKRAPRPTAPRPAAAAPPSPLTRPLVTAAPPASPSPPSTAQPAGAGQQAKQPHRWLQATLRKGDFIQVPTVLINRLKHFELQPHHLWLILMLQSAKYSNRAPSYFWDELAAACGRDKDTVRRWGRQLKAKRLIKIVPRPKQPGEQRRPGVRNDRNTFYTDGIEQRVLDEQQKQEAEKAAHIMRRQRRT